MHSLPIICPIHSLTDDALIQIFSYLHILDKGRVSSVCRRWNAVISDPSLWRTIDLWRLVRKSYTHQGGYWTFPRKPSLVQNFLSKYTSGSLKELRIHVIINIELQKLLKRQCIQLQSLDIVIDANDVDLSCLPSSLTHLTLALSCNTKWQSLPCKQIPSNMRLQSIWLRYAKIDYDVCRSLITQTGAVTRLIFDGCSWQVLPIEFRMLSEYLSLLKTFQLVSCHFSSPSSIYGIIHQMSTKCRNLTTFELNQPFIIGYHREGLHYRLDGILEAIGSCRRTQLMDLTVSSTGGLTLHGLASVSSVMYNLNQLSLASCADVTNEYLQLISTNLNNLTRLNISGCKRITDVGLRYLAHHRNIRELHLYGCSCLSEDGILSTIKTLPELKILTLPGWRGYDVCADLIQAQRPKVKVKFW